MALRPRQHMVGLCMILRGGGRGWGEVEWCWVGKVWGGGADRSVVCVKGERVCVCMVCKRCVCACVYVQDID